MIVINDLNWRQHTEGKVVVNGEKKLFGLKPRDFQKHPYGSLWYAPALPEGFILPDDELRERIRQKNADKSWIKDIWQARGKKVKDQNGTNFCWNFGVCGAVEADRAMRGFPDIELSPASGACRITNFSNEGGWGGEAIEGGVTMGWCSVDLWPQAAIDRRYLTDAAKTDALTNRVTGWYDCPANLRAVLSAVVRDIPVAVAFDWWSHLVFATFATENFGLGILNSWGENWSDGGFGVLEGTRAVPSDAQCLVSSTIK